MKLNTNKKLVFCLAALGASSVLFGFDSAETAETVLEKMQAASMEAGAVTMDMAFNLNGGLEISDGTTTSTIAMALTGDFDIAANVDPLAMSMEGSMNVSALGTNEAITMKMYGVTDESNQLDLYVYTEDSTSGESGWEHESASLEGLDIDALMQMSAAIDYSEYGLNFELAPETVDVDGTECYLLSAVMDSEDLNTLLEKSMELTGEDITTDEDLQMVLSILSGLKIRYEYYVDAATYLPVQFHLDLNDSDWSALNQYIAMAMGEMAEGSDLNLVVNDISADASMVYTDSVEITVPEEALEAVAGDADDGALEDALDELEDAAEELDAVVDQA